MDQQVLLDKLSEFLMVEQCGLQLYRVAVESSQRPELQQRYEEFGKETARHREVLVQAITGLGGDPDYVSPTARVAQVKGASLLESTLRVNGLSPEEREAHILENVLLAETKDHSDWEFLSQLAMQMEEGAARDTIQAAVDEVEAEEDEHLEWARTTLTELCLEMAMGPAPSPERWQMVWSGPEPPIETVHPAPIQDGGLLKPAMQPAWVETPISRSMGATGKRSNSKRAAAKRS